VSDDASAARRRRAKRDAIVADAVRLTRGEKDGWHRVRLSRHLSRAHKLPPAAVLAVLDEARELVTVGYMVRPRPTAPRKEQSPRDEQTLWEGIVSELVYFLSEVHTDTVYVDVTSARPGMTLRMRLDFVKKKGRSSIWVACLVEGRMVLEEMAAEGALVLSPDWSLPLVPPTPDSLPPQVAVWRLQSPRHAAEKVRSALEGRLGLPAERIRLRREVCTPGELQRRVTGQKAIHRLRGDRTRKNLATRSCDRCGQPLSDPESVRRGIGPECRRYYGQDVLDAVRRSPSADVPRLGAKSQADWLSEVLRDWVAR
jgi:hypothetical protein